MKDKLIKFGFKEYDKEENYLKLDKNDLEAYDLYESSHLDIVVTVAGELKMVDYALEYGLIEINGVALTIEEVGQLNKIFNK